MRDNNYTDLVGKEIGTLKVFMKARGDKVIEFSNDAIVLGFVTVVTGWVPRANLAEIFGVGLAEVRWANPNLVEDAEEATELVKLLAVLLKWI